MTDKEVLIPSRSRGSQEKVQYTPLGQLTEDRNGQSSTVIDTEDQKDSTAGVTTRKNVYILLGIAVLAVAVIVLSVVFTVYSGRSCVSEDFHKILLFLMDWLWNTVVFWSLGARSSLRQFVHKRCNDAKNWWLGIVLPANY